MIQIAATLFIVLVVGFFVCVGLGAIVACFAACMPNKDHGHKQAQQRLAPRAPITSEVNCFGEPIEAP